MSQTRCLKSLCYFSAAAALQASSTAVIASMMWGGRHVQTIAGALIMARKSVTDLLPTMPQAKTSSEALEQHFGWRDLLHTVVAISAVVPVLQLGFLLANTCAAPEPKQEPRRKQRFDQFGGTEDSDKKKTNDERPDREVSFVTLKRDMNKLNHDFLHAAVHGDNQKRTFNQQLAEFQEQYKTHYLPNFRGLYCANSAVHLPGQLFCLLAAPHIGVSMALGVSVTLFGSFLLQYGLIYWHGTRPTANLDKLKFDVSPAPPPKPQPVVSPRVVKPASEDSELKAQAAQDITGEAGNIPKWACGIDELDQKLLERKRELTADSSKRNFVVSYARHPEHHYLIIYKLHVLDAATGNIQHFGISVRDKTYQTKQGPQRGPVFVITGESSSHETYGKTIAKMLQSRVYQPGPGEAKAALGKQYCICPIISGCERTFILQGVGSKVDRVINKIGTGAEVLKQKALGRYPARAEG